MFLGPLVICSIVVASAYGIPWILDRLGDDPIMRKHINERSVGWNRRRRRQPDPSKFRKIVDDPEDEEDKDKRDGFF